MMKIKFSFWFTLNLYFLSFGLKSYQLWCWLPLQCCGSNRTEIVSPCYSFLVFLPFPLATQWTAFDVEVSCTQPRFVCYRYSLISSLLKNGQEYLPSFIFSEFLWQFLSKKGPTSCAKVHNSLFCSVLKVVWCSKSHTELTDSIPVGVVTDDAQKECSRTEYLLNCTKWKVIFPQLVTAFQGFSPEL